MSGSSGNLLSILPNNTNVKKGKLIASFDNIFMLDEIRGLENQIEKLSTSPDSDKIVLNE